MMIVIAAIDNELHRWLLAVVVVDCGSGNDSRQRRQS